MRFGSKLLKGTGPNGDIVEMLIRHAENEESREDKNPYKIKAFTSAIAVINRFDHRIESVEEVRDVKGIGKGIAKRIALFLSGEQQEEAENHVSVQVEDTEENKQRKAMQELTTIHGVGRVLAGKLVALGCMSLEHLRQPEFYNQLAPSMKVGLDFVDHLDHRVTRPQAEAVIDFMKDNMSSKFEISLVGSYRRESPTSSDVDVLIFHPSYVHIPTPAQGPPSGYVGGRPPSPHRSKTKTAKRDTTLLQQEVVQPLIDRGLIAGTLSSGTSKWRGVVLVPSRVDDRWEDLSQRVEAIAEKTGTFRRMDLNLIPIKSRGAALLALTGDATLNREMRSNAIKQGMLLNEYGLWRWKANGNGASNGDDSSDEAKGYWELVEAESEERIVELLGMEYLEPAQRTTTNKLKK
ncbi:DNA polymerase IV [Gelatoporia subvermispora B]|uniref:DNA polymerase n=1 Tax=Ceriporiopsis subvermispora (strain B) TaxID=914234 RepID=M2RMT3_CERS8|nr:DNA polymerase IV [Gelatoporia subvermispora B]